MLTPAELVDLSQEVASEFDGELHVNAASVTDGGSGRVEVLVTLTGCHPEPCRVMLNVTRQDRREFEADFRAKLHDALEKHRQ